MFFIHHIYLIGALWAAPFQVQVQTPIKINQKTVEASCGICKFDMKGEKCALAIRLEDGNRFWVSGFSIDAFGDAHGKDGFCQAIRKAKVSGTITKDEFKAYEFVLLGNTP